MCTAVALLIVSVIGALQWRCLLSVLYVHCSGVAYCQCYRCTAVALLIVSVIVALQWRYLLSVLQVHCSGVTFFSFKVALQWRCVLSDRVLCLCEFLILFTSYQCIFEARQLGYSCLLRDVSYFPLFHEMRQDECCRS
jgi:hypothetical protein